MIQNLAAALAYADLGWRVFPLRPKSKVPLTTSGFLDATLDRGRIETWFAMHPDAGIAVATGKISGITVVDIDPRNGGKESLEGLELEHGALPPTVQSITGGGGSHYFFKYNGSSCSTPYPGLDIKSDGGYVVVPFSTHPNGDKYHWKEGADPKDLALQDAPLWIVPKVKIDPSIPGSLNPIDPSIKDRIIPSGERNNSLLSLAGTMQRRGMTHDSILRAILVENDAKCVPPLPRHEVEALCASVTRYNPDRDATPGVAPDKRVVALSDVLTMAREEPKPIDWVLPGWLACGDVSILAGAPGLGKSWVTLELAITQAAGISTMGYFEPHSPRKVLIIDEENGPEEMWRRLRGLVSLCAVTPDELAKNLFISKGCQGFSFRDEGYVAAITELVNSLKPDIIIFDSLIAISSIKNENDAVEVRTFIHDKVYPLRSICNSCLIFIHHTSKQVYAKDRQIFDEGLVRGSIDLLAAPDSSFLIDKGQSPGDLRMSALKVRRGEKPAPIYFSLSPGESGIPRPLVHALGNNGARTASMDQFKSQRAARNITMVLRGGPMRQAAILKAVLKNDMTLSRSMVWRVLESLLTSREVTSSVEAQGVTMYSLTPS